LLGSIQAFSTARTPDNQSDESIEIALAVALVVTRQRRAVTIGA
jgi:hypothetical protein